MICIHPDTLNCILIAPDASDLIQTTVESTINSEVDKIKEGAPDIVIINE